MKTGNFIVSLDFDGVLAQGLRVKIKYAKKWFGVSLSLEQTKKDGFNQLMKQMGKQEDYRSLMDPVNEKHIMEYDIPAGCLDALERLFMDGFRFVVITSRNEHDYPYAQRFIREKFGGLIKYIHNTNNKPKDEFVRRLKPRIHMDDDITKLAELNSLPIELLYYRQPENLHHTPAGRMIEIRNWNEFEAHCIYFRRLHDAICQRYGIDNKFSNLREIFGIKNKLSRKMQEQLLQKSWKSS